MFFLICFKDFTVRFFSIQMTATFMALPSQEAMVVELQDEKRKLKRELRNARPGGLPASAYIVQM